MAQASAFLELIDGRGEPSCTLKEAVQTLQANLAVLASAEDGTWKGVSTECQTSN